MKWMLSVPILEKLIRENQFRTEIALYPGFCMNVLYVIFKTATGIYYCSAQFNENTEQFRVMMTALTGVGVSLMIVGMAIYMIVRASILLKRNTEDKR